MKKVLYVEDEPFLGKIVKETLEKNRFEVLWETDGTRLLNHLNQFNPDICVLDIMLPNINGYELCEMVKKNKPELPVIFLTAKVEVEDLVKGFEKGGTDYIRKPFSIEELIARIHNQLRLNPGDESGQQALDEELSLGSYTFYPNRYELKTPSQTIKLSQREQEVLSSLAANRNQVCDRKEILFAVWKDDSIFNSRNLDVYIRKLREYFKEDASIHIQTLKGKGYLFLAP